MKKIYITIVIALLSIYTFAQTPNYAWAKSAGGTSNDRGYSVSTDLNGNVYMTGTFYSTNITFGTINLSNAGAGDAFIVKYDANGNVLWAKSSGGTAYDVVTSVSNYTGGDVFVTGIFYSPTITFGTFTLTNAGSGSTADVFIVKYDSNGNVLWAKSAGLTGSDIGNCITTDASGNVIITGYFDSPTITFGTITLTNAGYQDIFIVKYDTNGNVLWAKSAGGIGMDYGRGVSSDASGNVLMTGYFQSPSITFGATTLTNSGNDDIFIVKYDVSGNVVWVKSSGGNYLDEGNSVSTDGNGNVFITGYFLSPTITFGTITLTNDSSGTGDIFLAKYDANGNALWANNTGDVNNDRGYNVSTDANGNVLMTGWFQNPSITFGAITLTNSGLDDIFIVKYDTNGNVLWAKSEGYINIDEGISICADVNGNVFITGWFLSNTISFGSIPLANADITGNTSDIFIAKLDATPVGMEGKATLDISIAPNPFTSQTTITFNQEQKNTSVKITDMLGKEIRSINFSGKQLTIEKEEMTSGIYFVQSVDEYKNVSNKKIIIQ